MDEQIPSNITSTLQNNQSIDRAILPINESGIYESEELNNLYSPLDFRQFMREREASNFTNDQDNNPLVYPESSLEESFFDMRDQFYNSTIRGRNHMRPSRVQIGGLPDSNNPFT